MEGTLQSLVQHHNLKASVLWRSAFFMVQLSHLYMTTGKTIAFNIQAFVGWAPEGLLIPLLLDSTGLQEVQGSD